MDKANHFRDQKGNTVVRKTTGSGTAELRLQCKRSSGVCVVVHFVDSPVRNVSHGQVSCKP
jgi:hypothetical protein